MSRHQTKGSESKVIIAIAGLAIVIVIGIGLFAKTSNQSGSTFDAEAGGIPIGTKAPPISLDNQKGEKVSLEDYTNQGVLLYFNEGVGCSSCWQQILTLEKDGEFMAQHIPLVVVTPDAASSWEPILKANPISSPILADSDSSVSRAYGMLTMHSSMHGGVRPGHTFVLIDKTHTVRWVGDYPSMNASATEIVGVIKQKIQP